MPDYRLKSPVKAAKITGVFYRLDDGGFAHAGPMNQFNIDQHHVTWPDGQGVVLSPEDFDARFEEQAGPLAD